MAEVAGVAAAFVALIPQILDLGNKWHKADRAWKRIPAQLGSLQKQHDTYMAMIHEFGLADNHHLREMLENARTLVEEEKEQREREDRRRIPFLGGCCFKVTATLFPVRLEEFLEKIEKAFDVVTVMQKNQIAHEVIKKEAFAKPYSFKISREGVEAHVPLSIDKRLVNALEEKDGPSVVLLHGDPGTGKSILARYIVVHYKSPIPGEDTPFSLVVFLECGSGATVPSKQLELLRKLAPEGSSDLRKDHSTDLDIQVQNRIQCLLSERSALVILDDVWETTFIKAFVGLVNGTSSRNVKLLVTCRKSTLWEDSVRVPTERIKLEEAEKILACHAGLPKNEMPQDLKDVSQGLVDRAQYNPLALAMVGKRINRKKNKDVGEWKRVADSYETAMKEDIGGKGTSVDLRPVLDFSYEQNIWQTLLMTYRELGNDAKTLLILIANCEGKSIPNHVVYMLYTRLLLAGGRKPELFDDHKNQLMESGTMLQTSIQFLEHRDPTSEECHLIKKEYEVFGLHDLQRNFIKYHQETRKDVEEVMTSLQLLNDKTMPNSGLHHEIICDDPHGDGVFALCAIYLQETFAEKAAKNLGMSAIDFGRLKKLRGALEHLAILMQDRLPEYDEKLAHCVKQVYVKVVRNGQLDDNGLRMLVSSLHYGPPTIGMLYDLRATGLCSASHTPGTIESLLQSSVTSQHTDESSCSPYRKLHLEGLGIFALFEANNKDIVEFPGALQRLMGCLSLGQNSTLRQIAVRALTNIGCHEDGKRRIGEVPGSISKLLNLFLQRDGNVEFQINVVGVLCNLSLYEANAKQILDFPGALEALLDGLSGGSNSKLMTYVAGILGNIARFEDGNRTIREVPGSMSKFLNIFVQRDGTVEFQAEVMRTLYSLAVNEANAKQILDFAGALEALLDGLSGGSNSNLMTNVAWTLSNIAEHEDGKRRIGEVPGSISKFLNIFLQGDGNVDFQVGVIRTLFCLAFNKANTKQILEFPGALEALVDGLSGGGNSNLMTYVAGTLAIIAGHDCGERRIGEVPGSISKFLNIFVQGDGSVEFQVLLMATLYCLAVNEANTKQILDFPGALEALLDGLSGGSNSVLKERIASTLVNIVIHEEGKRRIGEVHGSVSKLLKLFLQRDGSVTFQCTMLKMLWNLAVNEANAKQILDFAGAIEALLDGLSDGGDSELMTNITGTLGSIAKHEDGQRRIGKVPGSISKLFNLFLQRDGSAEFECQVLRTLCNLASYEPNAKQIFDLAGALEALLDGLSRGSDSLLMTNAARTNAKQILDFVGVIDALFDGMSCGSNSRPSTEIARTLASIAVHQDGKKRIGEVPESISKLLNLFLQRYGSVDLQCAVLRTLCNLASYEANAKQILDIAGAIEALLDGLSGGSNCELMTNVAATLRNITIHEDGQRRIGEVPGSISKVLKLFLQRDGSVEFQCQVLRTLWNLALYEINAKQILDLDGAIEALLDGLSGGRSPLLMTKIAGTLASIAGHEDGQKRIGGTPGSISKLLKLFLQRDGNVDFLCEVLRTLWNLAIYEANAKQILDFADALDALLDGLSGESNSKLMTNVAGTLANIARHEDGKRRIGEVPGCISKLLNLFLQPDGSVEFQREVLRTLWNLAIYEAYAKQILDFAGTLEALLDGLSAGGDPLLVTRVAGTLANITGHEDGKRRIGEVPGSIPKLLNLFLQRDGSMDVQCHVLRTLYNLASYEANAKQILDFPGALETLLDGLSSGNNSELMTNMAGTLGNIARHEDGKRRIGEVPGSISNFLNLFLQGDGSVEFQAEVMRTLCSLAVNEANSKQILDFPGALEALLDGLSGGSSSLLKERISWTLANIVIHEEGKRRIGEVLGSISKLLNLFLQGDGSVEFQAKVMDTMCTLALNEANSKQILDFPGALEALLDGLSGGSNSLLMERIAWTLGNIAIHEEGKRRIGEVPGFISKFLALFLQRDGSVECQCKVLRTLSNLAIYETNAKQILGFPGVLEALLDGLSGRSDSLLITNFARTLTNIAIHKEGMRIIGEVPGSISKLLNLFLQRDGSVQFQCQLLGTLQNLAIYEANAKQILDFAGAIEALLDGLRGGSNSLLMTMAARTLGNIARHEDGQRRIGEVPGSISKFVNLFLQGDGSVEFQTEVMGTLCSLAVNEANSKQILDFSGALEALLDGLSGGSNSLQMEKIAWTLGNIAIHEEGKRRIGEVPGSISRLLNLFLQRDRSVEFQCKVLGTLSDLVVYEANAKQILDLAGALEGLLDGLFQGSDSLLVTNVAGTLASIALHEDGKRRIKEVAGSISKLLKFFLQRDGSVAFECEVLETLWNLAVNEANAKQIFDFASAIEALLDGL